MLDIQHIEVGVEGKKILRDFSLSIPNGEVHVIMGPNGVGKSTLSSTITGKAGYAVSQGKMLFEGKDLTGISPEVRARMGIFLAMQHPIEIPGVSTAEVLRMSLNEIRTYRGEERLDPFDFVELLESKLDQVGLSREYMQRFFNDGFSGGEKKRNEVLQMLLLEPKLCILDEIDSGLDIDSVKLIGETIQKMKHADRSFLLITHYPRLLEYLEVDKVHVMTGGRIVTSGGIELAHQLEKEGYDQITMQAS